MLIYKKIIFVAMSTIIISCNRNKGVRKSVESDNIDTVGIVDSVMGNDMVKNDICSKSFEEWLIRLNETDLPYSFNEKLFSSDWRSHYTSEPSKLRFINERDSICTNYLPYKDSILLSNIYLEKNKKFVLNSCYVKMKFLVKDSIYAYVGIAESEDTLLDVLFTFSVEKGLLGIKVLGAEMLPFDYYLHQGITIDENLKVNAINIGYYESSDGKTFKNFKILDSGEIINTK